jgi:hypothetical protein
MRNGCWPADVGRVVEMKLNSGNKYLLKNVNDDFAPENITLMRARIALHIILKRDTEPNIVIKDALNHPVMMGMAEYENTISW